MTIGRRLITCLLALAVAVSLLVACGDDDPSSNEPYAKRVPNEQQKVELAIVDFHGANKQVVCDSLSSGAMEQLGGRQACLKGAGQPRASDYNVQSVRFSPQGEAIAVVRVGGKLVQFTLVDEDGEWKVSKPLPPQF